MSEPAKRAEAPEGPRPGWAECLAWAVVAVAEAAGWVALVWWKLSR